MTSMRAARAAGSIEATTAAPKQHKRRKDHGQGARHFQVAEITARHARNHEPECRARQNADGSHHDAFRDNTAQEISRAAIQAPGGCRIRASAR